MAFTYELTFAGIPFLPDRATVVRMAGNRTETDPPEELLPPRKHQPETELLEEIERLIPLSFLQDFSPLLEYPGRNLGALARQTRAAQDMRADHLKLNTFYYPNGAVRWGIFRGLATSSMAAAMLDAVDSGIAATFTMSAVPQGAFTPVSDPSYYSVSTQMYLMPPRPIGEGTLKDGLYLITLVDERFFFQGTPTSIQVTASTTWAGLISQIADALGVTVTIPAIDGVYGQPEPDSQLWTNFENAGTLLDAVAGSLGKVVVRGLDGVYTLQSPTDSLAIVQTNRGNASNVVRTAGGDIFYSGGPGNLPIGSLSDARNAVVPFEVIVTYPKYIFGADSLTSGAVPHYLNSRYAPPRPTSWFEDSYGDVHAHAIPIESGGPFVSGLQGVSQNTIHSTAKAYYTTEASAASGMTPVNESGLMALSSQIAQDYYNAQVATALDEVYPGTLAWVPDGIHDIVWTYSEKNRMASTRVFRAEWNNAVPEMQHTLLLSGTTAPGVGGHSVAQTWRDNTGTVLYGRNVVRAGPGLTISSGIETSGGLSEVVLTATGGATLTSGIIGSGLIASGAVVGPGTIGSGAITSGNFPFYLLPPGGGNDIHAFVQADSTSGSYAIGGATIYFAGQINSTAPIGGQTFSVNQIHAMPLWASRGGTIGQIACNVIGGRSGAITWMAIYNNLSQGNLTPTTLVVDGDVQDCSGAGQKTSNVAAPLTSGLLYWVCWGTNDVALSITPSVPASLYPIVGATNFGSGQIMTVGWKSSGVFASGNTPYVTNFPFSGSLQRLNGLNNYPTLGYMFVN